MSKPTKAAASAAGRSLSAMRKTKTGGHNGGRPRSDAPRCPCAVMTLKRAEARGRTYEHCPICTYYPAEPRATIV